MWLRIRRRRRCARLRLARRQPIYVQNWVTKLTTAPTGLPAAALSADGRRRHGKSVARRSCCRPDDSGRLLHARHHHHPLERRTPWRQQLHRDVVRHHPMRPDVNTNAFRRARESGFTIVELMVGDAESASSRSSSCSRSRRVGGPAPHHQARAMPSRTASLALPHRADARMAGYGINYYAARLQR